MVATISFTTIGLPVSLLCVYLLHYHVFTHCTSTICLCFVLLFVYLLHYHLFTICTTICLCFVLLLVYLLYYRVKELPQCLVSVKLPSMQKCVVLPFVDIPLVGQMSAQAQLSDFP